MLGQPCGGAAAWLVGWVFQIIKSGQLGIQYEHMDFSREKQNGLEFCCFA